MLLGGGQSMVAAVRHAAPSARGLSWAQLALWNIGTAVVAVADMARVMPGVAARSVMLIVALALFLAGLRRIGRTARGRTAALEGSYSTLVAVLARLRGTRHLPRSTAPGQ